jgi:N-acetyl-anhydromuramyl-L-alanine amidase AmpD
VGQQGRLQQARSRFRTRLAGAAGAVLALAAIAGCSATSAATIHGTPAPPVPDCPASLHCTYEPAAYSPDGNYSRAARPSDGLKIDSIVIHDTEESYDGTVATFANPTREASANYVVKSSTGDVTEMVRPQDVAWAVGNWYDNTHSVSIENEGFAAQGADWYTDAEYRSDAALVRYLAARYGVPLDREHIIGHDEVGGVSNASDKDQHDDPGPYWNWNYFMSLVRGQSEPAYLASQGSATAGGHRVVTISPAWPGNEPPVTACAEPACAAQPAQPASLTWLHTSASASAPLLSDPTLHPGGGRGTTGIGDWSAVAAAGEQYVLAGRQGDWTGIWFGGQVGWFYDPDGPGATARFTGGWVVTPRPGVASVPVYGAPYPAASAYPAGSAPRSRPALAYQFKAGQSYVTTGLAPDDAYAVSYDYAGPGGHTVVRGNQRYYQIVFNARLYYVSASEVTLTRLP